MTTSYNTLNTSEDGYERKSKAREGSTKMRSKMQKIGYIPGFCLVSGALGILAFVGYITFMWFSADKNPTWKNIALAGWTTRSIAIAAVVLRTAITVQSGISCSMIAGIVLEGPGVLLPKLAVISIMRSASPAPYTLFQHVWSGSGSTNWLTTGLAAILTVTTIFLQFTLTVLLADVRTGLVTAYPTSYPITVPWGRTSLGVLKWNVGVRQYPVFAEYKEGQIANGSSGLSDTGLTMRAFLPIDSQANRSAIHIYEGPAAVIDTRVVCVRPNVTNLEVLFANNETARTPMLHGNISIPLDLLDAAAASRLSPMPWQTFNCSFPIGISPGFTKFKYHPSDWDLSICQFDRVAGYLRNAWMTPNNPPPEKLHLAIPFNSYLLMNFTSREKFQIIYPSVRPGDPPAIVDLSKPNTNYTLLTRVFNDSKPGLVRQNRGEWTDVYRDDKDFTVSDAMLSFSMCFPASGARYLNVSTSSKVPLAQPRYRYDPASEGLRFDDVRKQMLSSPQTTMEQRGILSLEPQPWTPENGDVPPYLDSHNAASSMLVPTSDRARTVDLVQYADPTIGRADVSIGGLFLEILREGGTAAEAVQSMITTLLASRYEDYVFLEGGNTTNPLRADFVAVQIPGGQGQPANRPVGATLSYLLVMAAIAIHCLTVSFVIAWFWKATAATFIWQAWSNTAQVSTTTAIPYVERATHASDSEVETWIKDDGLQKALVTIVPSSEGQGAETSLLRHRLQRSSVEQNVPEQGLTEEDLRSTKVSKRPTVHSTSLE